jgi:hypothetical protein
MDRARFPYLGLFLALGRRATAKTAAKNCFEQHSRFVETGKRIETSHPPLSGDAKIWKTKQKRRIKAKAATNRPDDKKMSRQH